jgi:iron complex transport system substrate-binding protein
MQDYFPKRIICMTEETTELLYLLGEQDRIVGISGFTVRPPQARKEKPKVSAFTSAKIDKILDLKPDLVLGFSDLQADIAAELVRHGVNVHIFNQRSVPEIFEMIMQLGAMVGASEKAAAWIADREREIAAITEAEQRHTRKPRIYFEEWYEPIITGIRWVSDIIGIVGGEDCFPENALQSLGKNRIVENPLTVVERKPDIIIGSWCGRKFNPGQVGEREGWSDVPAVRTGHIYEIKSAYILQPGPAALTDGLAQMKAIVEEWRRDLE